MTVYFALHKKTRRGLAFETQGEPDDHLRGELGEFGELYRKEGLSGFAIHKGLGTVDDTIKAYGFDRPGLGFHVEEEQYETATEVIVSTDPETGEQIEYESVDAALKALDKRTPRFINRALNTGSKAYGLNWSRRVED